MPYNLHEAIIAISLAKLVAADQAMSMAMDFVRAYRPAISGQLGTELQGQFKQRLTDGMSGIRTLLESPHIETYNLEGLTRPLEKRADFTDSFLSSAAGTGAVLVGAHIIKKNPKAIRSLFAQTAKAGRAAGVSNPILQRFTRFAPRWQGIVNPSIRRGADFKAHNEG